MSHPTFRNTLSRLFLALAVLLTALWHTWPTAVARASDPCPPYCPEDSSSSRPEREPKQVFDADKDGTPDGHDPCPMDQKAVPDKNGYCPSDETGDRLYRGKFVVYKLDGMDYIQFYTPDGKLIGGFDQADSARKLVENLVKAGYSRDEIVAAFEAAKKEGIEPILPPEHFLDDDPTFEGVPLRGAKWTPEDQERFNRALVDLNAKLGGENVVTFGTKRFADLEAPRFDYDPKLIFENRETAIELQVFMQKWSRIYWGKEVSADEEAAMYRQRGVEWLMLYASKEERGRAIEENIRAVDQLEEMADALIGEIGGRINELIREQKALEKAGLQDPANSQRHEEIQREIGRLGGLRLSAELIPGQVNTFLVRPEAGFDRLDELARQAGVE